MKSPEKSFLGEGKFITIPPSNLQQKKLTPKTPKRLFVKSLIIPFILILSSCGKNADLAKVREFSELSILAKEQLPKIADDVYLSCLRAARYHAVSTLPPSSENITQGTKISDGDRLKARTTAQEECDKTASELGPKMRQGNAILALYVQKLGELASDNVTNIDPEFKQLQESSGGLASALGDRGFKMNSTQLSAGSDILKFVVEGILDGKRVDTLNEVIPASDKPLQLYSEGLKFVVKEVYIEGYLYNEEKQLDNYYEDYIRDILASKARSEGESALSLTDSLLALDDKWNSRKDEIQKRRELANSYINLLGAIAASHHELAMIYGKGQNPSPQKLEKMLNKNTKALKDFVDKAEKVP